MITVHDIAPLLKYLRTSVLMYIIRNSKRKSFNVWIKANIYFGMVSGGVLLIYNAITTNIVSIDTVCLR